MSAQGYRETILFTESEDGLGLTGLLIEPSSGQGAPSLLWVHGNTGSFADWPYVQVGRAIAARGLPVLSVDTRGHHISASLYSEDGREVAGGSGWERLEDAPLDIGPWVEELARRGARRVVLAGHSQGAAKAVAYAAERADPRVAGLVLASPSLRGHWPPELAAEAERLVAAGSPDTLLQPLRDAPWYQLSAANLVSRERMLARTYAAQDGAPLIGRVACPILAFFGTGGDVGGEEDLALIRSSARAARRVDTALIPGADHVYTAVEDVVGTQIAAWAAETLSQGGEPPVLP
jgi:pimeloyl-ACP methyl ester carboxylesterase